MGGAIYWSDKEPNFGPRGILGQNFTNNTALIYGDNIASYPAKLVSMNDKQY